jgi:hypothetical protein
MISHLSDNLPFFFGSFTDCSLITLFISRYQIPEDWPYQEARQLFKEPAVLTDEEQLDVKWTSPDEEVNEFYYYYHYRHHHHHHYYLV